jgi:hypothetical protein
MPMHIKAMLASSVGRIRWKPIVRRPTPERRITNPKLVARVRYAQGSVMPMIRQMNTHVTVPQTSLNGSHLSNRRGWNNSRLKGRGIECTISEITRNSITFNKKPPIW